MSSESTSDTGSKPISKYLVPPTTSTPSGPKTGLPRARLLTSAAALQILEEKGQKKEQEELKQEKKKEREENKQRKEERKKKAEERIRKADKKAKEKALKEEEKARKTAERNTDKAKTAGAKRKGKERADSHSTRSNAQPPKRARLETDVIVENECCMFCHI